MSVYGIGVYDGRAVTVNIVSLNRSLRTPSSAYGFDCRTNTPTPSRDWTLRVMWMRYGGSS